MRRRVRLVVGRATMANAPSAAMTFQFVSAVIRATGGSFDRQKWCCDENLDARSSMFSGGAVSRRSIELVVLCFRTGRQETAGRLHTLEGSKTRRGEV